MTKAEISLSTLFFTFAKIGVILFGGGYAMLPILEREIVEKRQWASREDLANYYAIGQCTPGVIAVNTATFIGSDLRGVKGGVIATLGFVCPSFVIIMAIAGLISNFSELFFVQKAFMGIRVCVCVLIFRVIINLWKNAITDRLTMTIFLLVVGLSLWLHVSPVWIVLADMMFAVVLELWCPVHRMKAKKREE